MIRRNTQDPTYWKEFRVSNADLDHLSNVLVEGEIPLPLNDLARTLTTFRCEREEQRIRQELSKGSLYLPKNTYAPGDEIVFPMLEYAVGAVTGVREGKNPEYGAFHVIQVAFPHGKTREFAIDLADHPLNDALEVAAEEVASPQEIYQEYGKYVRTALEARLESEPGFIRLAGHWFLRDLLVDINAGHLNLAEAVLDMAGGGPLPTEDLVAHLDLSKEVKLQLAVFSLNYALQEDERFDEVGPSGEVLWYLRRLQPFPVLNPPDRLRPRVVEYNHHLLDETMFNMERKLDDEWSELVAVPETNEPVKIVLTFPHRRSGTLPLSARLSRVFPTGRTHRIRFVFRDADTGEEMEGWVVRERRFAYGLLDWYERHDVPVGAYLEISCTDEPGVILIRRNAKRVRREWTRSVTVVDGQLSFAMSQFPLSCEVDDLMVIMSEDLSLIDAAVLHARERKMSLADLVRHLLPELSKLSPQGMVHAATVYSAVNLVMRVPPGPILATLVSDDQYTSLGDNYWVSRTRNLGF
ncbi:MAG: hypothetical protein JXD18_08420 [Anaerolineae bacterium]|nr:hypothetical protein [Anaerolineae bacterium]